MSTSEDFLHKKLGPSAICTICGKLISDCTCTIDMVTRLQVRAKIASIEEQVLQKLYALSLRLRGNTVLYKIVNDKGQITNDWWMTAFTHDQYTKNQEFCRELIKEAIELLEKK